MKRVGVRLIMQELQLFRLQGLKGRALMQLIAILAIVLPVVAQAQQEAGEKRFAAALMVSAVFFCGRFLMSLGAGRSPGFISG